MITSFIELGYSNGELNQLFNVGGYRLDSTKQELIDLMILPDYIKDPWMEYCVSSIVRLYDLINEGGFWAFF